VSITLETGVRGALTAIGLAMPLDLLSRDLVNNADRAIDAVAGCRVIGRFPCLFRFSDVALMAC